MSATKHCIDGFLKAAGYMSQAIRDGGGRVGGHLKWDLGARLEQTLRGRGYGMQAAYDVGQRRTADKASILEGMYRARHGDAAAALRERLDGPKGHAMIANLSKKASGDMVKSPENEAAWNKRVDMGLQSGKKWARYKSERRARIGLGETTPHSGFRDEPSAQNATPTKADSGSTPGTGGMP